jgi:uncharacterized membrane protein YsdA (DUF1294 family)
MPPALPWLALWFVLWFGLASLAAFALFAIDKARAARNARRIPERTLHALELLGGWPGALAAMALVRHKNRKPAYWLVTLAIIALHAGLAAAWLILR